jgi:hypothetical protein
MNRQEAAVIARAKLAELAGPVDRRFWSKVDIRGADECWPWLAAFRGSDEKQRYGAFWMNGRHHPANRVALELSGVPVPEGKFACHRCDFPPCCNPAHLFAGTNQENTADKVTKSRQVLGERVHTAKLTEEQVLEIRSFRPEGMKVLRKGAGTALSEKYGVSVKHISDILARRTWKSI